MTTYLLIVGPAVFSAVALGIGYLAILTVVAGGCK